MFGRTRMQLTCVVIGMSVGSTAFAQLDLNPRLNMHLAGRIRPGEFSPTEGGASDCWGYTSPSGREYGIIGLNSGVGFAEVTDPKNPQVVAYFPGPTSTWHDMKTYQDHAYSVNENSGGIRVYGLQNIDGGVVTNLGNVITGGRESTHDVAVNEDSGFLYRCGGGGFPYQGLRIYDLATPASPAFVGEWHGAYCHDAQIVNWTDGPHAGQEVAFCYAGDTSGGGNPRIEILNVSDKSNITVISTLDFGSVPLIGHPVSFAHQGWLSEDRRYVYMNDEIDEGQFGTPTTTRIIDVQDLDNPAYVAAFTNGNSARDHNLYVVGNTIYEANYTSGFRIFDATDPLNPVETAFYDTVRANDNRSFGGLWGLYPFFASGTVIGSDGVDGLMIVRFGEAAPDEASSDVPPPHDIKKNRYLSFSPPIGSFNNHAIRVDLTDKVCDITGKKCSNAADCTACTGGGGGSNDGMACVANAECDGTCAVTGESCNEQNPPVALGWVSQPYDASCQDLDTGDPLPGNPACLGVDLVSRVVAAPVMRYWSNPLIHIGDCEIAPAQTYQLTTSTDLVAFSAPTSLRTIEKPADKFWADLVGNFNGVLWSAPNGLVNVDDVSSFIKFATQRPAPHITVVDVARETPNWLANATDLQLILKGALGEEYPPIGFSAQTPGDCP